MVSQKEAKRLYRERARPMGVFQVRNWGSGRIYVAAAADLPAAMNSLRFQLANGLLLQNPELQAEFSRLGAGAFAFEELDRLEPREGTDAAAELKELERLWLEKLQPFGERGYNRRPAAS